MGQADEANPMQARLVGVRESFGSLSVYLFPPQAFERRNNKVEIALDVVVALLAHLNGVGNAVKNLHSVCVCAIFVVGVALAAYGNVVCRRHINKRRLLFWKIKLFVFLFEIEWHNLLNLKGLPNRQPLFVNYSIGI